MNPRTAIVVSVSAMGVIAGSWYYRANTEATLNEARIGANRQSTPVPGADATKSAPQGDSSTGPKLEEESRLAALEAEIDASVRELQAIGTRETELQQLTTSRPASQWLQDDVRIATEHARKLKERVSAARQRKEVVRARIEAMLRKIPSTSERKRWTPRADARLDELEDLSTKLEEVTVKGMLE